MAVNRRPRRLLATVVAIASVPLFALVPAASGHVDPPTVTAVHAFIGDPLFGLDTAGGSLFGILPDERTAEASSTKLMTLDLTVHALNDGVVSLGDLVTINAFEAGVGGSSMKDILGTPLEDGEVITLELLIRGMMYPSGNNAAYAIARHVAQAYLGAAADWPDFVDMMNDHAADLGLTDTHFANPNGFDDPDHYTTARELSEIIEHGLEGDPYFQEVIGFVGTWTGTSQGPNGTKTYMLSFPFFAGSPPPGWEGGKGGGTTNCNGPNNGCMAASAKRIGRRVVLAFMQGQPWTEEPGMFDYGFGQIFHPDPRGSSVSVGAADRHDLDCFSTSRCLSAVLPSSGDVKLVSWEPDVDGSSIAKLDEETLPGSALPPKNGKGQGPSGDVALTRLPGGAIVVANRKGASVELSRWSIDGGGSLSLLSSGEKAGPATTMDLQPVAVDMFFTAVTDPDGALVLKSWQLDGSGLAHLDTYRDESRIYSEVAMAGPLTTDVFNGHRAVTAAIAPAALIHDVWGVDDTTGDIARLGELVQAGTRDRLAISPFFVNTTFDGELFPPVYYATVYRTNGTQAMRIYRIDATGTPVNEGSAGTLLPVEEGAVAQLGTAGIMVARRAPDGTVELVAWDARRDADDSIDLEQISQHTAPSAGSLDLAEVDSTHAEGDYATAVTDPIGGALRLRLYRSGDRPY
jgi:D-alanyl-D-alanine carboxypeptidase